MKTLWRKILPCASAAAAACGAALLASCSSGAAAPASPGAVSSPDAPARVAPTSAVLSVEPWDFGGTPGRVIRTEWYRIYTTDTDKGLMDRMPAFMESALDRYTTAFGPLPRPPVKLDAFVMANRAQWIILTTQKMGDRAPTFLRIQRGGFASGGVGYFWNIGPRDTLAISAHEGWHQYTQRAFRQPLPVWLEEGIASYMEGFLYESGDATRYVFLPWANIERFDQLRKARENGKLKSLEELLQAMPGDLLNSSFDDTLNYYAQVWALVQFLKEGEGGRYSQALYAAVSDAASGRMLRALEIQFGASSARSVMMSRRGPGVFMAYFDQDLSGASAHYAEFVTRVVGVGSRDRIVQGKSPVAD